MGVAPDEAKENDEQIAIGDLRFLLAPEVKRVFSEQGGLHIDYQVNDWGGRFEIQFDQGGECC